MRDDTLEMEVIPPTMTASVRTVRAAPMISLENPNVAFTAVVMELAWVIFPIPKEAMTVNMAKIKPI